MHDENQSAENGHAGKICGVIVGLALCAGSVALLANNEASIRVPTTNISLGKATVVSVAAERPDPANNGKLVHITGPVTTPEMLADEMFYLNVNAISLQRIVEMYQWREDKTPQGFSYSRGWDEHHVDFSSFHDPQDHTNPMMPLRSAEYKADVVNVGGFALSPPFVEQMNDYADLPMTSQTYAEINPELSQFWLHGDEYYSGKNPYAPEVGDMRVRFRIVTPGGIVSIAGQQYDGKIEPYHIKSEVIQKLVWGDVGAGSMFVAMDSGDWMLPWVFRLGGGFGLFAGLVVIMASFKRKTKPQPIPASVKFFKVPKSAQRSSAEILPYSRPAA